jgi:hypothetical protein
MPVWQVALLLNLTFAVGLGLGYAGWGRRAEALDKAFDAARAQVEQLERERAACGPGGRAGERKGEGRGVFRARVFLSPPSPAPWSSSGRDAGSSARPTRNYW